MYGYSYIMLAMAVQRRFSALQNDANIAQYLVEGHFVGRELGTGSYGSVEEVLIKLYKGWLCVIITSHIHISTIACLSSVANKVYRH